jgi:hypothetical protein
MENANKPSLNQASYLLTMLQNKKDVVDTFKLGFSELKDLDLRDYKYILVLIFGSQDKRLMEVLSTLLIKK